MNSLEKIGNALMRRDRVYPTRAYWFALGVALIIAMIGAAL